MRSAAAAPTPTNAEFTRQRDKLLNTLAGLGADVIGLNELENTTGVEPIGDPTDGILAGLNAMLGAGSYDYIDTGVIGTDAIRVGLIYRPDVVTPVGPYAILDSTVDPRFIDTKSRPVLAQTFMENSTGERLHGRRQPPEVEGLRLQRRRRSRCRRRPGQLQRHPHGRRTGTRRLVGDRSDR